LRGALGFRWVLALLLLLVPIPVGAPPMVADVVVWGGTPEGVSAAIAAAREGAKVILAVDGQRLGGVLVEAELNTLDQSVDSSGRPLNEGLFVEWYRLVEGDSFNPVTAERAFHQLIATEVETGIQRQPLTRGGTVQLASQRLGKGALATGGSLQVIYDIDLGEPIVQGGQLVAVTIRRGLWSSRLVAKRWIDASADADLAASAGVPFTVGWESLGAGRTGQAAGLVFRLRGLDWERATEHVLADENPSTGATKLSIWGFPEAAQYRPLNPNLRLRALNVGRVGADQVLINGLLVFGVDPLDSDSRRRALAQTKQELPRIVAYLREVCPGFEGAELAGTADSLYIRESRHLANPLYQLTLADVNQNRSQPDAIAWGSYPVDVQPRFPGEPVRILGKPTGFAVPLRSLLPASMSNLAIASRSAGYSPEAHGSARTVPLGMAAAQGAGVAAALSLQEGVSLHQVARRPDLIDQLHSRLAAQGVRLLSPTASKL
jgi:hypothetical protein